MPGRTEGVDTTYDIQIIGRLWLGGLSAFDYMVTNDRIKVGDEDTFAGDLWLSPDMSELENVEHWLTMNSGDFQEIVAARIVRSERKTMKMPDQLDTNPLDPHPWSCFETWTRETLLRDFTEEASTMYDQCMFPNGD